MRRVFPVHSKRTLHNSEWLANIMRYLRRKGSSECVLIIRSAKDDFPLPHIDVLVDNTAGHTFFSFMDGFSRYNQIDMAPKDRAKTIFLTPWGTLCTSNAL